MPYLNLVKKNFDGKFGDSLLSFPILKKKKKYEKKIAGNVQNEN